MDKRILRLSRDPFRVELEDRSCSVFIDPKAGAILIDEGEGEDRLNGAVMYPDKAPHFSIGTETGETSVLLLDYSGFRLLVGTVADLADAQDWASAANRFLATKAGQKAKASTSALNGLIPEEKSPPRPAPASSSITDASAHQ